MSTPPAPALDAAFRDRAWAQLAGGVDLLVVGGGVTGAGVALDASLRGLSVGLVEQRDFAAGTSSRSSKLVHGGLRYLEQLNFGLVREALRERTLLLETLAPHLVRPLPFLLPLRHRVWERPYVGAGLTLYDTLGGMSPAVPRHSHLSKSATLKACPSLRPDNLAGAIRYHDAQVDDARLTVELVRTAAAYGTQVLSAARVVSFLQDDDGRVRGARVLDAETGQEHEIPARVVVNAGGVWAGRVEVLAGVAKPVRMRPSKGVHVVVPRDRIDSSTALISRTKTSVLFVLPWGNTWIIGTTDTPWSHGYAHPAATHGDVAYLLAEANKVLSSDLAESDVMGLYAGLRPLIDQEGLSESALSREHLVSRPVPGLVTITGGKFTTYRVMAEDAVDACAEDLGPLPASTTDQVPLLGAGTPASVVAATSTHPGAALVSEADRARLAERYGTLLSEVLDLVHDQPALARPLGGGSGHLGVEVVYAAAYEGALHIDDVLTRRTRIYLEAGDRGLAATGPVALLMGRVLGWDDATRTAEATRYQRRIGAELESAQAPDDDTAAEVRSRSRDPRLPAAD